MSEDHKGENYQQYLERKHSLFKADSSVIGNVIKKATGEEALEHSRIVAGEINEVYSVKTKKGDFIVRIGRRGENRFHMEQEVLEKVKKTGVPVPEVLLVDQPAGSEDLHVCVERKLPGEPISGGGFSDEELHRLIIEAGEILAKIHSVNTRKFGRLEGSGAGKFNSWEEYMLAPLRPQKVKATLECAERIGVDKNQIDKALTILADNTEQYKGVTPHLLHGDFGPKHILVADGKISGILDFENAMSGDPVSDFSWWKYHHPTAPPIAWLMEGYGKVAKIPDDFELKLHLGKLRTGMDLIWWYDAEGHTLGANSAKRNLQEDLIYFSHG